MISSTVEANDIASPKINIVEDSTKSTANSAKDVTTPVVDVVTSVV